MRQRILQVFSRRVKRSGIRSVLMAELASELRMSATTLYNHFPSKEELVRVSVERWGHEAAASSRRLEPAADARTAMTGLMRWAERYADSLGQFSPAFFEDLRRDHPEVWRLFRQTINQHKREGADYLRPHLRDDIHPEVALAALGVILDNISNPRLCARIGVTRRTAVETGLRIWARGALRARSDD